MLRQYLVNKALPCWMNKKDNCKIKAKVCKRKNSFLPMKCRHPIQITQIPSQFWLLDPAMTAKRSKCSIILKYNLKNLLFGNPRYELSEVLGKTLYYFSFCTGGKYSLFILQVFTEPLPHARHCFIIGNTNSKQDRRGSCSLIKTSLPFFPSQYF